MEKQVEIVFSKRARRRLLVLAAPFKQAFGIRFRAIRSGLLIKKDFNAYLKKLPGVKGFRRLLVEIGKNEQCMIAFVDDSHPYITVIFCTHLFTKKTKSVPGEELEKAAQIVRQEYYEKGSA